MNSLPPINKLFTHSNFRLTRDELERKAYIEDWKIPESGPFYEVFSDQFFAEDTRPQANMQEGKTSKGLYELDPTVTSLENTIKLLQVQLTNVKTELEKVYKENGCTPEEVKTLMLRVSPGVMGHSYP